ncbi:metalloregulator ArsR/SmtB family transcription factor [bacterium]|nr:metalloregulator ArsR/SmtB family transcription factor [bacterium]
MSSQAATIELETIFRALSDRTRLRILNLLRDGELCVCDLVEVLEIPQPTASRHLTCLRKVDLVLSRKEGLWLYYRLKQAKTKFQSKLFECIDAAAKMEPQFAVDEEKLKFVDRAKCCD